MNVCGGGNNYITEAETEEDTFWSSRGDGDGGAVLANFSLTFGVLPHFGIYISYKYVLIEEAFCQIY